MSDIENIKEEELEETIKQETEAEAESHPENNEEPTVVDTEIKTEPDAEDQELPDETANESVHEESKEPLIGDEEPEPPVYKGHLTKNKIKDGYEVILSLRTILICPFDTAYLMAPDFLKFMNSCQKYEIKKTSKGDMSAELKFETTELGKTAFAAMKEEYAELKISRPPLSGLDHCIAAVKDHMWWSKFLVLEGLKPEINTEEILNDHFREAENAIPFSHDPLLSRFALLEFLSLSDAKDYLDSLSNEPVMISDVEVKVCSLTDYLKSAPRDKKVDEWKKKCNELNEKEEIFTDEERIELYKEILELLKQVNQPVQVVESIEATHQNLQNLYRIDEELKFKKGEFQTDTELRKDRGDTEMPEKKLAEETDQEVLTFSDVFLERELEDLSLQLDEAKRHEQVLKARMQMVKRRLPPDEQYMDSVGGASYSSSSRQREKKYGGLTKEELACQVKVENLPSPFSSKIRRELRRKFEKIGPVEEINEKGTRGCVVIMTSEYDATQAMAELTDLKVEGSPVILKPVTAQSVQYHRMEVLVTNLPDMSEKAMQDELKSLFVQCGEVTKIYYLYKKSIAFVRMVREDHVKALIDRFNDYEFHGQVIKLVEKSDSVKSHHARKKANRERRDRDYDQAMDDDYSDSKRSRRRNSDNYQFHQMNIQCYNCSQFGHYADQCPKPEAAATGTGRNTCYNCGMKGHFASECGRSYGNKRGRNDMGMMDSSFAIIKALNDRINRLDRIAQNQQQIGQQNARRRNRSRSNSKNTSNMKGRNQNANTQEMGDQSQSNTSMSGASEQSTTNTPQGGSNQTDMSRSNSGYQAPPSDYSSNSYAPHGQDNSMPPNYNSYYGFSGSNIPPPPPGLPPPNMMGPPGYPDMSGSQNNPMSQHMPQGYPSYFYNQ